jgi:hypothetical protein
VSNKAEGQQWKINVYGSCRRRSWNFYYSVLILTDNYRLSLPSAIRRTRGQWEVDYVKATNSRHEWQPLVFQQYTGHVRLDGLRDMTTHRNLRNVPEVSCKLDFKHYEHNIFGDKNWTSEVALSVQPFTLRSIVRQQRAQFMWTHWYWTCLQMLWKQFHTFQTPVLCCISATHTPNAATTLFATVPVYTYTRYTSVLC